MKKISKYFTMATVSVGLFMQNAMAADDGICGLIKGLGPIIKTLRTLAFVGAAFVLMDWAWGMIKDPDKEATKDKIKEKGIGLFVGFFLLFGVGVLLQYITSASGQSTLGCTSEIAAAFGK